MNLKSRLSQLQIQAGAGCTIPAAHPVASNLRSRLAQLRPERLQAPVAVTGRQAMPAEALARAVGGEPIAAGVIQIRQRLPLTAAHGSIGLQALCSRPQLPGETDTGNRRPVYIDTETTGLSGGSGTLAFLVGLAVIGDDALELTQFLLTRFAAEATLLAAFAACLSPADRLVSYNGKSYDLPLLTTRFRMQGLSPPFAGLPHLDLLQPVRRLFGRRWNDCRLLSLEQQLLGFRRVADLPGSEAPAAWFDYIRHGAGEQLIRVVEHHRQDIVSLAAAHTVLARAITQPQTFDVDIPALARWQAETDEGAARELLHSHAEHLDDDGRRLLAHLSRRAGDWAQAVAVWESLAAGGCTDSLERLAKYHEHVNKDLAAARRCCGALPPDAAREQRLRRLDGKLRKRENRRLSA
jgi:uncharacterized protein YprB with RNaseH-like and TPR domain